MSQTANFCAGSLTASLPAWHDLGAPDTVLQWLRHGVYLSSQPIRPPAQFVPNPPWPAAHEAFIHSEIQKLVNCGVLRKVPYRPHVVSPIHAIPKQNGKLRLITDLRYVNKFCDIPKFSNEDIRVVVDFIQPHDCLVTLDLQNGYYHIPVHPDHQDFLGISCRGHYYVWQVLPFGATCSPYYFNKVLRPVIQHLRQAGLRLTAFVDDFLLCASPSSLPAHKAQLLNTLQSLGFHINFEKSHLSTHCKTLQFIGYIINTDADVPSLSIPVTRLRKLQKDIRRALRVSTVSARFLARILGQCVSMTRAILPGKLLLRNAYRVLSRRSSWSDHLTLDSHTINDLQCWLGSLDNWNGAPIQKPHIDCQLVTDASGRGWGGHLNGLEASGLWDTSIVHRSSNYRELLTVLLSLHSFRKHIPNLSVQVLTDNITTVAYLNHLGGPYRDLSEIATAIWVLCSELNVRLTARHISGVRNVLADGLSRIESPHDWELHPRLFRYIDQLWGPHSIDRFASITNAKLPHYNSLRHDPLSSGIDALAQTDWHQHNNYVNAPIRLLPQILSAIQHQQAIATIVAPYWPAQTWCHTLQRLSIAPPIRLGGPEIVIPQATNRPEPWKNHRWVFYAWRISGRNA
jgi:hypothetical protein